VWFKVGIRPTVRLSIYLPGIRVLYEVLLMVCQVVMAAFVSSTVARSDVEAEGSPAAHTNARTVMIMS